MTAANIITWLVIGGIVGVVIALSRQHSTGGMMLIDLLVGVVGGFIGGVLLNAVGGIVGAEVVGINLGAGLVAIVAAIVLVALVELFTRTPQQ